MVSLMMSSSNQQIHQIEEKVHFGQFSGSLSIVVGR